METDEDATAATLVPTDCLILLTGHTGASHHGDRPGEGQGSHRSHFSLYWSQRAPFAGGSSVQDSQASTIQALHPPGFQGRAPSWHAPSRRAGQPYLSATRSQARRAEAAPAEGRCGRDTARKSLQPSVPHSACRLSLGLPPGSSWTRRPPSTESPLFGN